MVVSSSRLAARTPGVFASPFTKSLRNANTSCQ